MFQWWKSNSLLNPEHSNGRNTPMEKLKPKPLSLFLSSQVADLLTPPSQLISTIYHSRQLQFFNYHILLITSPQRDSSEFKRQELLSHLKRDIFLERKWFIWVNKNVNVWYLAAICNHRWFFFGLTSNCWGVKRMVVLLKDLGEFIQCST